MKRFLLGLIMFHLQTSAAACSAPVTGVPSGSKISGGDASPAAFMGALLKFKKFKCGATLISQEFCLSAAQCVETFNGLPPKPKQYTVLLGKPNMAADQGGLTVAVMEIFMHPDYNHEAGVTENDIVLLRIEPVTYSGTIQAIGLVEDGSLYYAGRPAYAAGWGRSHHSDNPTEPGELQKVELKVISTEVCNDLISEDIKDYKRFCTLGVEGSGPCKGDSGGPVVFIDEHTWTPLLAGIISVGPAICGDEGKPSINTNSTHFRDFYQEIMNGVRPTTTPATTTPATTTPATTTPATTTPAIACGELNDLLENTDFTATGQPNPQKPWLGATSGYSLKPCSPKPDACLSRAYENMDFPGADYRELFTADYEQCQRACTQDPGCEFFTFVSGLYEREDIRYKCLLKFTWTVPKPPMVRAKDGAVSGFSHKLHQANHNLPCQTKMFPKTDIPGHDLDMLLAVSPEHCLSLCSSHPLCTFFTYFTDTDKRFHCYLKSNAKQMVTSSNEAAVSGIPTHVCQPDNSWVKAMYEGVDFPGSDMRYVLLDDPDSCQRNCTEDHNCQFYTYVTEAFFDSRYWRRCYLKRVITMPAPPKVTKLDNVMSGFSKKNCQMST